MRFKRSRKNTAPEEDSIDLLPPPPVIGWRVPPMGSMGDAWDSELDIPKPEKREKPEPPPKRERRTRHPDEVVFVDYVPPLHYAAVIAWVFIGLAVVSTGPAYNLMPLMALGGAVAGIAAGVLLRTAHTHLGGEKTAWSAVAVALLFIILDMFQPSAQAFQVYYKQSARRPVGSLQAGDRQAYMEKAMGFMARIAWCAFQAKGPDAVGIGRQGVNRDITSDPDYFNMSTLVSPDMEGLTELEKEYLVYEDGELPSDPYARDPRATFGVYLTESHILIYSIGPDGKWQINPRKPVDEDSYTPEIDLAPYIIGQGAVGDAGDIVLIVPMIVFEEMGGLCEYTRGSFEELQKTGHLPFELDPPEIQDSPWPVLPGVPLR